MVNVFRNTMEAIDEGGCLTLDFSREDERTVLRLLDDGRGIAPEVRGQLWVPFVSTKRDGRGIGLTLVREIAAKHGWQVALEPRAGAAERGTEFQLTMNQ